LIQIHKGLNRPVNLLLEEDWIVPLIPPRQFRLDCIGKVWRSQEPLIGTEGLVIDRGNGVSERTVEPTRVLSMSLTVGRK
jgi:hypothetical protein